MTSRIWESFFKLIFEIIPRTHKNQIVNVEEDSGDIVIAKVETGIAIWFKPGYYGLVWILGGLLQTVEGLIEFEEGWVSFETLWGFDVDLLGEGCMYKSPLYVELGDLEILVKQV